MPQADVDRAVPAGGEPFERAVSGQGDRRQVRVHPRDDVLDDVVLPHARPFAAVRMRDRPRHRHDRDERPHLPGRDQAVGDVGDVERVPVLGRRAAHAVQEIDDRVAPGGREPGWQIDGARSVVPRDGVVRDAADPDGAAVETGADLRPARQEGGGEKQRPHGAIAATRRLIRDYGPGGGR